MKKYIGIITTLVLVALAAGFFVFSSPATGTGGRGPGGMRPAAEQQAIPVKTMKVTRGTLENYIRITGDVKAASTVDVYPDASGTLASIDVSTGDYLQTGSVVAAVDPSRPGAAYSKSPVDTPIAGTVTEIYTEVGQTVSTSVPILAIGRLDELEIRTQVAERYANSVQVGQRAYIEADAVPGTRLAAHVSSVSPVLDPATRTMEIKLAFDGLHAGVKAGMLADITLIIERKKEALKIPAAAVTERSGGYSVFVVSGSTVEMRSVQTGLIVDGIAEITSGLSEGETIVYSGMSMLIDGSAVRVVSEDAGLPATGNVEGGNA